MNAASSSNMASLFTNNSGQVVFVNQYFLEIMRYPEAGVVTGQPLFKALRVEQQKAMQLIEDIRRSGTVKNQLLHITNQIGETIRLSIDGNATEDTNGNFLGVDITLRKIAAEGAKSAEQSVAAASTTETVPDVTFADNTIFLQLYFTTQIKSIYVLLQRVIGLNAAKQLDSVINQTAKKNQWNIAIKSGLFSTDLSSTRADVYKTLLQEVMTYAVNMVGVRVIATEAEKTDQQMHQGVLTLAQQSGLRELYRGK